MATQIEHDKKDRLNFFGWIAMQRIISLILTYKTDYGIRFC